MAIRFNVGSNSLVISSRFAMTSPLTLVIPVMLPPRLSEAFDEPGRLNLRLLSRLLAKAAHVGRELYPRVLEDRCCSKDQVNLGTVPTFLCREFAALY